MIKINKKNKSNINNIKFNDNSSEDLNLFDDITLLKKKKDKQLIKIDKSQSINDNELSSNKKKYNKLNFINNEVKSSLSSFENNSLYKKIKDKNIFFNELLKKQLNGISNDKKLNYNDIKRISKFIKSSIFDKKNCSIWDGYITNENNTNKGIYINFYFNKKKIALHRLLYINYVGELSYNEYLKFICKNKGKCCNIHHMKKYTYNKKCNKSKSLKDNSSNINKSNIDNKNDHIQINIDKDKLIVDI